MQENTEYGFWWRLLFTIGKLPTWVFIVVFITGLYQYNKYFGDSGNAAATSLAKPVKWLSDYYKEFPIGGGWTVSKISAEKNVVIIYIMVPQAYNMMEITSLNIRRAAMRVACPGKLEDIWKILPPKADIWLTGKTPAGDAFIDVQCLL